MEKNKIRFSEKEEAPTSMINFFNGIILEFEASNRQRRKDPIHLAEYKWYYRLGDSVVVKFSRIDKQSFEFFNAIIYTQL